MDSRQADLYLDHLRVEAEPPGLHPLTRLVTAHLDRVPFENLSKVLWRAAGGASALVPLARFLDDLQSGLGGTCYACAAHFRSLLQHLGYEAWLCGADMTRPDVHAVIVVRLEGVDHLVDVGYGAPLFAPIPLEGEGGEAGRAGPDRYVLRRGERWRMDVLRDGEIVHGYTINPSRREAGHFRGVIERSFDPSADFMTRLRFVRHTPKRSLSVLNASMTIHEGQNSSEKIATNRDTLRAWLVEDCGVAGGVAGAFLAAARENPHARWLSELAVAGPS